MSEKATKSMAIVRGVANTYDRCVRSDPSEVIDVPLAKRQHALYCDAVRACGIDLVEIPADDRYPDCCFVEDPALVIGDCAIIPTMGVGSRRGEAVGVRDALSGLGKTVLEIDGTLEGGDVVQIGERVFVGLSGRTNREGISALESAIGPHGYEIVPVEIRDTLHLKSVCAYLGKGHLLVSPGHFEPSLFEGCTHIEVEDEYSVNCIELNGQVIIAEGFPKTVAVVEQAGFATRTVPTSEFRKGDGGLSCLSIRF